MEAAPLVQNSASSGESNAPAPTAVACVEVQINGSSYQVPASCNIVEACRQAGVYVPTVCYHPRLKPVGKCGVCTVDIEGSKEGVLACSTKVAPGMRIHTDTPEVKARCSAALTRLMNRMRSRQAQETSPQASREFRELLAWAQESAKDETSNAVVIDPSTCIECGRCARACKELQGIGALKLTDSAMAPVQATSDEGLYHSDCISCGQCSAFCPTGAIHEVTDFGPLREAIRQGKVIVAQTAPATRVAFAEEWGLEPGTVAERKMVGALKASGCHFVFDTNFTADLTILEEGTELLGRIKKGGPFPMITSCCPAWINMCEKLYPEFLPNLSTCKSPEGMLGALIKTYWADRMGKKPTEIFSLSIMPCTAKKDECRRDVLGRRGYQDVDMVLTTREAARWVKEQGFQEWAALPERDYDNPLSEYSGGAVLFAATGGVMEAALRTAYEVGTGRRLESVDFRAVRGWQGIREATVDFDGRPIKVAVAHSAGQARKLLDALRADPEHRLGLHFIEIMSCQGGCIGGGGQPKSNDPAVLQKRAGAIYALDTHMAVRRSHENVALQQLYTNFLGAPNSHKAHELLHTHYRDRSKEKQRTALVLYATQTGNSEQAARRLSSELQAARFAVRLAAMDAIGPAEVAREPLVLLVTSTFGEGERPDMAGPLWDWLAAQPAGALSTVAYGVFGLGSSKYTKFCQAARDFDGRLEFLGARRVVELGKGDETADDGYATAFDPWVAALYDELGVEPPKQAVVPHYRVMLSLEASQPVPPPPNTMFATLVVNKPLTPEDYGRPIIFSELDIGETGFEYSVGDSLGIHPLNPTEHVDAFLHWYHTNPDAVISIVPASDSTAPLPLPPTMTVRHLFERYLDIFARPRKIFFRQLAQFAQRPDERARLERLQGPEGKDDLAGYLKDFPSYVNVLQDFPSAHPTMDYLVEMIPPIKPRLYSVASTPKEDPHRVQLVVAIPTEWSRQRRTIVGGGLCTTFLFASQPGALVPVNINPGTLRPPPDPAAPMLLVALGTGVAPMRALLRDRLMDKRRRGLAATGPATLYQACRHREKDWVLRDEMAEYQREGVLTTHIGAFSHDQPGRFETADLLMTENPAPVWDILKHPNAYYFYCGPAAYSIPAKLETAIVGACQTAGGMSPEKATEYVETMKREGRFLLEAF
ncbi:iron hydrogenase [Paratrimastix pyriformis]|uniref:NADPH--hemoprotein reductase n=1 Tax=Paratrimastix pyriformis TaxID=342808 RepID=A0ABQ8USJ2_9EUKA|nr:iron hydrogenase [Paratrimastix pyriformis]